MKKLTLFSTLIFLSAMMFSCKKDGVQEIPTTTTAGGGQIKFFNFGVGSPSLNFYANNGKISAVVSTTDKEATTGLAYGGVFPTLSYSLLMAGSYAFSGVTPALATTDPNVVVSSISFPVEADKFYSLYTCGLYNTANKTTDAFVVEDKLPPVSPTTASIRFVNTISNALSGLNLVLRNTTTLTEIVVATNISYKTTSEFVQVPNGTYEVFARYPTGTANVISRTGTSVVAIVAGRSYTITSRGDMTVTSTTAASRPFLDNTPNRTNN
jgi:hypothetical protein